MVRGNHGVGVVVDHWDILGQHSRPSEHVIHSVQTCSAWLLSIHGQENEYMGNDSKLIE